MADIYVFVEGGANGSQFQLWNLINQHLYSNILKLVPCDGYKNIIQKFMTKYFDSKEIQNDDLILFDVDRIIESRPIAVTIRKLGGCLSGFEAWPEHNKKQKIDNAYILDNICFEDNLLTFKFLKDYLFSSQYVPQQIGLLDDYLKYREYYRNKRGVPFPASYNNLVNELTKSNAKNSRVKVKINLTIENLSERLLLEITRQSPGNFSTNKGALGKCFYNDCIPDVNICKVYNIQQKRCNSGSQQPLHTCGLFKYIHKPLIAIQKLEILYKYCDLNRQLKKCKEYFLNKGYDVAKNIITY